LSKVTHIKNISINFEFIFKNSYLKIIFLV